MPPVRIELTTPSLRDWCSTTELYGLPLLLLAYNAIFIRTYKLKLHTKEVQIVYRLFLVNYYLLLLPTASFPAS